MPSLKPLNGIAHDLAHHAQSGLSWLHPHLGQVCREAGVSVAVVELATPSPYPLGLPKSPPLVLALVGLHQKLVDLLSIKSLSLEDISSLELTFAFSPNRTDDFSCEVKSSLVTKSKKVFEHHVR
jgi:hypothetical protein